VPYDSRKVGVAKQTERWADLSGLLMRYKSSKRLFADHGGLACMSSWSATWVTFDNVLREASESRSNQFYGRNLATKETWTRSFV